MLEHLDRPERATAWRAGPPSRGWRGADLAQLLDEQLEALARWHEHRAEYEEVVEFRGMNRELRLDLQRRQMVRHRQHEALLGWAALQLSEGRRPLHTCAPRAVLVHRREWLRGKVAEELTRQGVEVLAQLDDGADAVGVSVVEQPDLLLAEDALPTMNGVEVLRAVQRFSPRTRFVAQVESDAHVAAVVQAGAATAFPRRTPPADLARGMLALVRQA